MFTSAPSSVRLLYYVRMAAQPRFYMNALLGIGWGNITDAFLVVAALCVGIIIDYDRKMNVPESEWLECFTISM